MIRKNRWKPSAFYRSRADKERFRAAAAVEHFGGQPFSVHIAAGLSETLWRFLLWTQIKIVCMEYVAP